MQSLARAIAVTLESEKDRGVVRQAMRESPMTEHKLVLQDFLNTQRGKQVAVDLAHNAGIGEESLRGYLQSLPRLDFYMPSRKHRLKWRGDASVLTTGNVSPLPQTQSFNTKGEVVAIDLTAMVPSRNPLLMLEYEEYKSRRIDPQPLRPGLAIQDPDDGTIGVVSIDVDRQGRATVTDLADVYSRDKGLGTNQKCQTCGGGGGGGGGGGTPATFLRRIQTIDVCDNANCSEGNEFEFRARNSAGATNTLRIMDIPSTANLARNDVLISGVPSGTGMTTVHTVEADISSGDDTWSYATYTPNYLGDIRLTSETNGSSWELKENPCCVSAFDFYRVGVAFGW